MISSHIPSNLANLVAPFLPAGQRPVGQETASLRNSTFKPVEQPAKSAQTQVQLRDERRDGEPGHEQGSQKAPAKPAQDGQDKSDEIDLYSPGRHRRAALRGCLLDETI